MAETPPNVAKRTRSSLCLADDGDAVRLVIIADPGEDLDDEMAMVCLRQFVERGLCAPPEAVVCNLRPARQRARLMRGTLDALGFGDVPVGVGAEVTDGRCEGSEDAHAVPPATYGTVWIPFLCFFRGARRGGTAGRRLAHL